MSARASLAPLLESFFRHRLTKQRNASPRPPPGQRAALLQTIDLRLQKFPRHGQLANLLLQATDLGIGCPKVCS